MTRYEIQKKIGEKFIIVNNEKGEFLTIEEAEKLKNLLKIPKEELNEYFFATKLEYSQEIIKKKRGKKNKNEVL